MKKLYKKLLKSLAIISFTIVVFGLIGSVSVFAATTPDLGAATTYGVLGGTYTDTTDGTTITNGDVGYTTLPATPPTMVGGTIYGPLAPTPQARIDATTALTELNLLTCPPANNLGVAVDLSLVHGALYTPGVYCSTGAMSIGTAGITLDGAGTYVFRADGTFNTVIDSVVTLTGGASACDIFWTPTGATTFGANTIPTDSFFGTIIDNNNFITVGINVGWLGRALSLLDGVVTTDTDSITVPACAAPQLTVTKVVTNDNGGTVASTTFPLFIDGSSVTNEIASTTTTGAHIVSETYSTSTYTQTFSGNCSGGNISLAYGDDEICTITNDDIAPSLTLDKIVDNSAGGSALESQWTLTATGSTTISGLGASGSTDVVSTSTFSAGTYILSETGSVDNYSASAWSCTGATLTGDSITLDLGDTAVCTITNTYTAPSFTATLHIIKLVSGGTATSSDFTIGVTGTTNISTSSFSGSSTGVDVTLDAGSYVVTETGNLANYSSATSTGCTGTITAGETKECTITNTYTAPVVHHSSGGSSSSVKPAIEVTKVVNPSILTGPGLVLYTYTLNNTGTVSVSDVTMADDTCSMVTLISGDTDLDHKLDVNETWIYQCYRILLNTTTNTIVATGQANGLTATDTAKATATVLYNSLLPLYQNVITNITPSFPNAGFAPVGESIFRTIINRLILLY